MPTGLIAVTGASGLIGNVLVRRLLEQGRTVRAITHSKRHEVSLDGLPVERVTLDILNPNAVGKALEGADVVYHLAAMVSVSPTRTRPMYRINVRGTQNVIQACLRNHVRRLIYTSSVAALVPPPFGTCIDESAELAPEKVADGYGRSKARAAQKVLEAAQAGLDAVVVYPSGVIGPHDFKPTQTGQTILDYVHRKIIAWLDGAYDFVDVRDVANGLTLAAEKGRAGRTYLLSGSRITVRDMFQLLEELTGVKAPWFKLPHGPARVAAALAPIYYGLRQTEPLLTTYSLDVLCSNCEFSSARARLELGYATRPIQETVKDTLDWFRQVGRISGRTQNTEY
jgi:dihydroflavonol-4-reductase